MAAIKTFINGIETTHLSCEDRGFHYGDGLFETLRIIEGEPKDWSLHFARLRKGCERLHLAVPDEQHLHEEALAICQEQELAVLKIILTRGKSGRGYRSEPGQGTRVVQLHAFPNYPVDYWVRGINIRICDTPVSINPKLAGIKHLNRLENVLARNEWQDENIVEGIMTDGQGRWVEGTMTNLFLVKDKVLYTPELSQAGVEGVMRQRVIRRAIDFGITTRIQGINHDFAFDADELFVTNSLIGIWPVKNLEGQSFPVGTITTQLAKSLLSSPL